MATWVQRRQAGKVFGQRGIPVVDPLPGRKVGELRSVLRMVDSGLPLRQIEREAKVDRQTIRKWRDDPKFREATYEYDPLFSYDENDLLDRAMVAHHLCSLTGDAGERLDLLFAAVGFTEHDEFSVPSKKYTTGYSNKLGVIR